MSLSFFVSFFVSRCNQQKEICNTPISVNAVREKMIPIEIDSLDDERHAEPRKSYDWEKNRQLTIARKYASRFALSFSDTWPTIKIITPEQIAWIVDIRSQMPVLPAPSLHFGNTLVAGIIGLS